MAGIAKPDNVNIEMTNYEIVSYSSYNNRMHSSRLPYTLFNEDTVGIWPQQGWDFNYEGDNLVIDINERCNLYVYIPDVSQRSPLQIEPNTYEEQLPTEFHVGWYLFVKDMQPGRYTFSHKEGYNTTTEWYFEKIKEDMPDIPEPPILPEIHKKRLNSNIYKNIFPEEPFDMSYIADTMDNTITTTNDIKQESHNLSIYDVVYLDTDGKYKKAIAENSKRGFPVGVVSGIPSPHVFTLITTGLVQYDRVYTYDDTSILYLSDKDPGKLVHYEEIDNTIYIPIAVYTNQGIIVNILQGSIGSELLPYEQEIQTFEPYSLYEINQLIVQVKEGVIDDG